MSVRFPPARLPDRASFSRPSLCRPRSPDGPAFFVRTRSPSVDLCLLVVMFVAGIAAAGAVPNRLSTTSRSRAAGLRDRAEDHRVLRGRQRAGRVHPRGDVPEGQTIAGSAADVQAVYDALRKIQTVRVVDYSKTKDKGFITSDGRTTFGVIYEPQPNGFVDPNQKLIQDTFNAQPRQHGFTGGLTGYAQLSSGGGDNGGPSVLEEPCGGARRPGRARVRRRLPPRSSSPPHRRGVDPHDVPHRAAPHRLHRRELRRAVPHRPGGARRGDRLLVAVVSRWREEIAHGHDNQQACVSHYGPPAMRCSPQV